MDITHKTLEPLATNRWVLTWLCIYPPPKNTTTMKRLGHILFSFVTFAANFSYLVVSFIFLMKYIRVDLNEAFFAIYQVAGMLAPIYCNIIAYFIRHSLSTVLKGLTKIYHDSE